MNLIAWQEAMNAETPEQQTEAFRRHSVALRQHMRDLSEKNYPKAVGANALELTIAFVPIEGALSAALGFDASLQGDAFDRRVVFASPNTLMALLRVVERLWTRDKIQRQAQDISDMGGLLLDSVAAFLKPFELAAKRLEDASSSFNDARRTLVNSDKGVLARAKKLHALGVRGRQSLPLDLLAQVPGEEIPVSPNSEATPGGLESPIP